MLNYKFHEELKSIPAGNVCEVDNDGCEEFCFGAPDGGSVCGCGGKQPLAADQKGCGADPLLLISGKIHVRLDSCPVRFMSR